MKSSEIKLTDWTRILAGDVPPLFYLELVIRALLVYTILLFCMRLLGKRMSTQISRLELAALVAFASAIGVPMLSYDRGILPALIIALLIVGMTKLITRLSFKSQKFEEATQGDVDCLVTDTVLNYNVMRRVRITRERLFAHLRSENISHLGAIKRIYLEANGTFSTIINETPKPGLMTLPEQDTDFINETLRRTDILICKNCGEKKPENSKPEAQVKCNNCGDDEWTNAVEAG